MFINIKTIFDPINNAVIEDIKCPNCQAKDYVEIVVYQKHIDTGLIYRVTKNLSGTANCLSCNTDIPNVKWTPEIESTFETLKKASPAKKPYKKYSFIFKLLLTFLGIMAIGIGYSIWNEIATGKEKIAILENPTINNKLLIAHSVREDYSKIKDLGNSWAIIREVNGDTIVIQFDINKVPLEQINDSEPSKIGYDGKIYKIKKEIFQNKERITEYHQNKGLGLNYAYIWKLKDN